MQQTDGGSLFRKLGSAAFPNIAFEPSALEERTVQQAAAPHFCWHSVMGRVERWPPLSSVAGLGLFLGTWDAPDRFRGLGIEEGIIQSM